MNKVTTRSTATKQPRNFVCLFFGALTLAILSSVPACAQMPVPMPGVAPGFNPDASEMAFPETVGDRSAVCPTPSAPPAGGPQECTMIGCVEGVVIQLDPGLFKDSGCYRMDVEADGKRGWVHLHIGPMSGCPEIGDSKWLIPLPPHNVTVNGYPRQLTISLHHANQLVTRKQLLPTYRSASPNGAGCGPACCQASVTLTP